MKEVIKIDRATIIEQLTSSMFDSMENDADYRWSICQWGHQGFENMHNDELIREYVDYLSEDPNEEIVIQLEEKHHV